METLHEPVLFEEVLKALAVEPGDTVIDATIGGAGHFSALLAALHSDGTLIGIDADGEAVERARAVYAQDRRTDRPTTHIVNDNFRNLENILTRLSIGTVDKILFDLGWSGYQLHALRGFSFQGDEPLMMTYGEGGTNAAELLNQLPENELADLIYHYGEERYARSIARSIVAMRKKERILTTGQLVSAIEAGTPKSYREGPRHVATKTFQALRIAANDELGALTEGLTAAVNALSPHGSLAVITFHSIEDRMVKDILHSAVTNGRGVLDPKKPIVPTRKEILKNRRARSAKLRILRRLPHEVIANGSHSSISSYA